MYRIRTDLAMESFQNSQQEHMPGVRVNHWEQSGVYFTEVLVETQRAATQLGKPMGAYLTLECPLLPDGEIDARTALASLLGEELARMLSSAADDDENAPHRPILVVGLGNRLITPDSLGPMCVDGILVTRHMFREMPKALDPQMNSVCAIAPGVLGVTGVETIEMVESLSKTIKPRAIICVDALSARASERIGSTIQLSNTGIQPGAGVGNHRKALTQQSVGAPVIAIGMPTVVYAATLARDMFALLGDESQTGTEDTQALEALEQELLRNELGDMIVTPREVDTLVAEGAKIIAQAINQALQPHLSVQEIGSMME